MTMKIEYHSDASIEDDSQEESDDEEHFKRMTLGSVASQ
jgi:hypothetical protein